MRDPWPYPSKGEGGAHDRTKRIGTCHGMGSGRERRY